MTAPFFSLHRPLRRGLIAAAAGLILSTAGIGAALAQSSVKAIVNGEPVTSNEIAQRARFLRLVDKTISGDSLMRVATNEMIEERLKMQEAKARGITASDAQVEAAYAGIGQRVKLSPAQLGVALGQAGVDPSTLKNRLRGQIVWQQLVMNRFRATVRISDQDVVAALQVQNTKPAAPGAKPAAGGPAMTTEYTLKQVIFVIPAAQRAALAPARIREAEALRAKVTSCDTLEAEAKAFKEVVVKNAGRRIDAELPGNYQEMLKDVPVGKLTKPAPNTSGLEMIAICDRKEIQSDAGQRAKIEDDLRQKEGEMVARRYINELKQAAVIEMKK